MPGDAAARVRARLAASAAEPSEHAVVTAVRQEYGVLGQRAVLTLAGQLQAELVGAGVLQPLLHDPMVTDVLVNGPHAVFVDRGHGLEPVPVSFADEAAVRALAVRLATAAGRRLDDAVPWVDATLPGGTRLHAVLPPLAPDGPLLSLRVLGTRSLGLDDLVRAGAVPSDLVPVLRRLLAARLSFLVTGGTGAGKTTVLAALLSLLPAGERIVLVEDTPELRPRHPHVVRLVARAANVEGVGAIGLDVLVRQAMRMRPDRLVVGVVRGAEVVDLLAALNTGHDGGCGTVHANSSHDVPARMEALGLAAGLGRDAVHSQLAAAVRVVLHVARAHGSRRLAEVALLERHADGVSVRRAWVHDEHGRLRAEAGADLLESLLRVAP
jgi:pilus assembly protein CpaF